MALVKFCNAQGCKRLCSLGERYCTECAEIVAKREAERQAAYDQDIRHGRDAQFTAFYHSGVWEDKRLYIIDHYDGIDVYAYYVKHKIIVATLVHHVIELKDSWALRLTDSNLIPVSDVSHREIGRKYREDKVSAQQLLRALLVQWHREHTQG